MHRWEYMHVYFEPNLKDSNPMQKQWDSFGEKGWDLVSVVALTEPAGVCVAFFKHLI
jgi:hypothetical protein